MKKGILLLVGGLALLVGCGNQGGKSAGATAEPKWKGAPYRLSFDTQANKPVKGAIALPIVKYTANPDALETRAILVTRFEASGPTVQGPVVNRMIGTAVDVRGAEGALPADYMERASKGLAEYLGDHCLGGNVKVSVALARSSLSPGAAEAEIDAKRLSDWLSTYVDYKNPHPKCK